MDMLSFESLHASLIRVRATEKEEAMIAARVAAHGDKKVVREWEKLTHQQGELDLKQEGHTDEGAFKRQFGKGF